MAVLEEVDMWMALNVGIDRALGELVEVLCADML